MDRKYLWHSHKDTYSCDVTFVNSSVTNLQYYGVTFVNSSVTKLYDANYVWEWLAICEIVLKSVTRSIAASHLRFLKFCLKKVLKKLSGRSNVFIISKRHSSLSNKFYDRNQTLQAEAISNIVRIDWPDWLVVHQFFMVMSYICDYT